MKGRHEADDPLVVRVMPGVTSPWKLAVLGRGRPLHIELTQEERNVFVKIWYKIGATPGLALDLTIDREHVR